jgi:hypothetical protein
MAFPSRQGSPWIRDIDREQGLARPETTAGFWFGERLTSIPLVPANSGFPQRACQHFFLAKRRKQMDFRVTFGLTIRSCYVLFANG